MPRLRLRFLWILALVAGDWGASARGDDFTPPTQLRRPAALAVQGERLFVANRRSGSVSVVDLARRAVVGESSVGLQLEDLTAVPNGDYLVAADSGADQLLLLHAAENEVKAVQRVSVPGAPVSVCVAADGSLCAAASLWGRRIGLIEIARTEPPHKGRRQLELRLRATIDLPFAPRLQWLSRDGAHLVVADAFGGRLAVIDTDAAQVRSVRTLHGHNLRGMVSDPEERELLVSHQILNEAVPTTRERVFWGTVMGNVLRSIPLEDLLSPDEASPPDRFPLGYDLARWSMHPLGRPGAAAGDPAAVAVSRDGKAIVALAGVNEIAFRTAPLQPFFQRPVGRRPVAVAFDPQERFALVANMFDDSISFFDFENGQVVETLSLGPQPELTAADRGEIAFFDARFSLDGWYSCHSCHTDGHSNGLRNDNFTDETEGAPKRILSLLGAGDTGPWAWSGAQKSLREQIRKSITATMRDHQGMHATPENIAALAAYLESLPPAPSLLAARGELDPESAERGRQVFQAQGCADCHRPPAYTTPAAYDVGLHDEVGRREFNPPSLRGVSQREALFHDNRAANLEEALTRFQHGDAHQLPPEDRAALLIFLRSL